MEARTATEPGEGRSNGNGAADAHGGLPNLIDVATLAAHLGVTERTIRRRVAEGEIPFLKLGHLIRFDPLEIQVWLDEARVPPHTGHPVGAENGTRP